MIELVRAGFDLVYLLPIKLWQCGSKQASEVVFKLGCQKEFGFNSHSILLVFYNALCMGQVKQYDKS